MKSHFSGDFFFGFIHNKQSDQHANQRAQSQAFNRWYLFSCFCSRSRRVSSWFRCCRLRLCSGVLRGGGVARLQLGTSWYWPLLRSPQKLKMLDTPEKAPVGEEDRRRGESEWGAQGTVGGGLLVCFYLTGRCRCSRSWGLRRLQRSHWIS